MTIEETGSQGEVSPFAPRRMLVVSDANEGIGIGSDNHAPERCESNPTLEGHCSYAATINGEVVLFLFSIVNVC